MKTLVGVKLSSMVVVAATKTDSGMKQSVNGNAAREIDSRNPQTLERNHQQNYAIYQT